MTAASALLVALALSAGDDTAQKRAQVAQELAAERLALEALRGKESSVKDTVALLNALAREKAQEAKRAQSRLNALARTYTRAHAQAQAAERAYEGIGARLSPRLAAMYRLTRRTPLDVLLSARDFASLVWRGRALAAVVGDDLELLAEARDVLDVRQRAQAELLALESSLGEQVLEEEREAQFAESERAQLTAVASALGADATHRARLVHDLEASEQRLTRMAQQLAQSARSAFGKLKGHLPLPVTGLVEVGFGRIVNPRFNTVTVQKGLDIRAPSGTPVRAIAAGRVVYTGALKGYGSLLILEHGGGFHTLMAHLGTLARSVGDEVQAGDSVATVGETGSLKGPYLYFELRQNGEAIDPTRWLSEK